MQWVSVKDKMPKDNQKVLVLIWDTEVFPATFLQCKNGIAWIPEVDCIDCANVGAPGRSTPYNAAFEDSPTHWMPLPEPPTASNNVINLTAPE